MVQWSRNVELLEFHFLCNAIETRMTTFFNVVLNLTITTTHPRSFPLGGLLTLPV